MLNVFILSVIMLSVIMLSVVILKVVVLSVLALFKILSYLVPDECRLFSGRRRVLSFRQRQRGHHQDEVQRSRAHPPRRAGGSLIKPFLFVTDGGTK
jgi:hypothetical protein